MIIYGHSLISRTAHLQTLLVTERDISLELIGRERGLYDFNEMSKFTIF